jgi:probable rRNA maturation factor
MIPVENELSAPAFTVDVIIDESYQQDLQGLDIQHAAEATLQEFLRKSCAICITITGDDQLRELNRDYLNNDQTTDVLSFGEITPDFVSPTGDLAFLGDIVISYPQAQRQAEAGGHAVGQEVILLAVHGILHLLGHDHGDDEERHAMWQIQDRITQSLGLGKIAPTEN